MLQIGPYKLDNNLVLAPMAGVTDRPFRQLCRNLGAGLAVSEMVSADPQLRNSRKGSLRINHQGEQAPISVQIAGSDPGLMAEAAQYNVAQGAQIIDINMGCPAKKVCKKAAGSALLKDEVLVEQILSRTVMAVPVPVTLKIRTGWDSRNKNALRIAKIAEQCGIQALTVHGRTRACGYQGEAEYDTILSIKQSVSIPIIANGDIQSAAKAKRVLEYTGADGLMIGRAAQGRPWIFREINHYLTCGDLPAPPTITEVRNLLLAHVQSLYTFYGDFMGLRIARKHVGWYLQTHPESREFRRVFNQLESTEQQLNLIQDYFDRVDTLKELAA